MTIHDAQRCGWSLFLVLTLTACGAAELAPCPVLEAGITQHALNRSALRQQAADEVAATWLASEAVRSPHIGRSFRDYVTLQRWLHQELLEQLQVQDLSLDVMAVSPAGRRLHRALEGLQGPALEAAYYAAQQPWQEAVLQRLKTADLPDAFRAEAQRRWGRDLAALKALQG